MNAVIAVSPIRDFYFTPHRFSALGPTIVRSILEEQGCEAQVLLFPLQAKKPSRIEIPPHLGHLEPHIVPDEAASFSYFTSYHRFGPAFEDCAAIVQSYSPDLVFLSCFAFCYADDTIELAQHVKRLCPGSRIIAGGAGVSCYPEYFLEEGTETGIDFAVRGEAEVSLRILLGALRTPASHSLADVPNLMWRDGKTIISSQVNAFTDSEEIHPAIVTTMETKKRVYLSTSLTRGCTRRCRFCSNHLTHGSQFRTLPFSRLVDLLLSSSSLGTVSGRQVVINFEDDNLLLDVDYFLRALGIFRERLPGVRFRAENGLDYTLLRPESVRQLVASGMEQFNLSLVSRFETILAKEQRRPFHDRFEVVLRRLDECGTPAVSYFICGLEEDTRESIAETIAYLGALPTRIGISPFYAVPGLTGFRNRRMFLQGQSSRCAGSSAFPWHGSLTTETIVTAFRLCRLVNAVKRGELRVGEPHLLRRMRRENRLYTLTRTGTAHVQQQDRELVRMCFERWPPSEP